MGIMVETREGVKQPSRKNLCTRQETPEMRETRNPSCPNKQTNSRPLRRLGPVANLDTKLLMLWSISKGSSFGTGREKQIGRAYGAPRQPSTLPPCA